MIIICKQCNKQFEYTPINNTRKRFCDECLAYRKNLNQGGVSVKVRKVDISLESTMTWDECNDKMWG